MKNLLLIMPLALSISVAMAQTPSGDMKTSTKSLDGKSFKITMTSKATGSGAMDKNDSYDSKKAPKDNTKVSETETVDGTAATTADAKAAQPGQNMETLTNKKMIVRFENGAIRSSALTAHGMTTCPYNVTSNSGSITSFTANCSNTSGSVGTVGSSGTTTRTSSGSENKTGEVTNDTYGSGNVSGTGTSGNVSGTGTSGTGTSETGTSGNVSGTTTTTAQTHDKGNMKAGGMSQAMWSGTVDGNNIKGNLVWTNENGQSVSYSFTGTKATQKDLDSEQELGSK